MRQQFALRSEKKLVQNSKFTMRLSVTIEELQQNRVSLPLWDASKNGKKLSSWDWKDLPPKFPFETSKNKIFTDAYQNPDIDNR